MIRSLTAQTASITRLVFSFMALLGCDICLAQATHAPGDVLPLSPALAPGANVHREVPRTVQWEQREYSPSEGLELLMRIIMDPEALPQKRANALQALSPFGHKLRNTDHIPELIALYDTFADEGDRRRLVGTLAWSEDPRVLPLFARCLKEARDDLSRWGCADVLARWNIRQGVSVLIDLSESAKLGPERGGQSFTDAPMGTVLGLNRDKGWGLPDVEIVEGIDKIKPRVNDEERRVLFRAEVKKWFEANKDRFPDWKPGDSLPVVVVDEPTPESVHQSRIAANHWTCEKSCDAPGGWVDCAACCQTHEACMECFATSFPPATPQEIRKTYCDSAFKP